MVSNGNKYRNECFAGVEITIKTEELVENATNYTSANGEKHLQARNAAEGGRQK